MEEGGTWSDFDAQAGALESASLQDCATACKALDSLERAAQHICEVAPEHCEAAKARAKSAADRVHAACPSCEVRAETKTGSATGDVMVVQSAPSHGGCAGCAMAAAHGDAGVAIFVVALLAGIRRRRGRRNDLRRVRDALRVEADAD
jgi:MYXO-CTERM domain-containing protein